MAEAFLLEVSPRQTVGYNGGALHCLSTFGPGQVGVRTDVRCGERGERVYPRRSFDSLNKSCS